MSFPQTREKLIEHYDTKYPWEYYKYYPEFCINKLTCNQNQMSYVLENISEDKYRSVINKQYLLNIDSDSLQTLPPIELRDRKTITDWLSKSSITYDDLLFVGW